MVNKAQQVILIAMITVLSLFLISFVTGTGELSGIIDKRDQVKCEVEVDADILSEADINSAVCFYTGKKCRSLLSIQTLSLIDNPLEEEIHVVYETSDHSNKDKVKAKILFGQTVQSTGTLCTDDNEVNIKLINDKSATVDTQTVEVQ
tara:strand:+ start:684 stop:1127 length:444 start_codon:yes stop_codon:yes gene_type:complete